MGADLMESRRAGLDFAGTYPASPAPDEVAVLPARFVAKVEVDANGCWLWTASLQNHGYGRIGRGNKSSSWTTAHRFAYELVFGVPEPGMDLDHLCRVTRCANPWHVEAVPHADNMRRGRQANASGMCRAGRHEWTDVNILTEGNGSQRCRPCRNEWYRVSRTAA